MLAWGAVLTLQQIDFARSVYASGTWFDEHPECVLNATDGYPVMNNASKPKNFPNNIGHWCVTSLYVVTLCFACSKRRPAHCALPPSCSR